jgi:hypothetical protein
MKFESWQSGRQPGAPFTTCSPNLKLILDYCNERWGLTNLGCYYKRPIRGGTTWSSHAFGAAQDLSYRNAPSRQIVTDEVIPWLVDNHEALGIQRVHDYIAKRYWQVGKGWIGRPPGFVNDHLHIEVNSETWHWDTPIEERLKGQPPAPKPEPVEWVTCRLGSKGEHVELAQQALADKGYKNSSGKKPLLVDGLFGETTDKRTRQFQTDAEIIVDGIFGKQTAGAIGLI